MFNIFVLFENVDMAVKESNIKININYTKTIKKIVHNRRFDCNESEFLIF